MTSSASLSLGLLATLLLVACARQSDSGSAAEDTVARQDSTAAAPTVFGVTSKGDTVHLYTLRNSHGMEARVIDYGAIIVSLKVPDRNGKLEDVVLGFDSIAGYEANDPYFGALIGRYGNRIARGQFTLDGKSYSLAKNNGPNSLHGGNVGFNDVMWHAEPFSDARGQGLVFTRTSPAGEEGYPGNLDVKVTYTLSDDNALKFDYEATTDAPTPVNLTQHSYFNLSGDPHGDILGHVVTINADAFTPVDSTLIPTGEIKSVQGTPFDFRTPHAIGERIDQTDPQLKLGPGYDHNFVLARKDTSFTQLEPAATVYEPKSGRVMEVSTTQPGLQFYSGNFLDGTLTGKGGIAYQHRTGFAMETQHFPDSPNQPKFPSTILRPGQTYHSETVYRFSTRAQ
jgi:aldose 1-epimerase